MGQNNVFRFELECKTELSFLALKEFGQVFVEFY